MRDRLRVVALVTILACGLTPSAGWGSGSYNGRPPRPPTSMDRGLYELGKAIFTGELAPGEDVGSRADQARLLDELVERLPRQARNRADLPKYAGKLRGDQIEALRYYLAKRYNVR